MDLSENVYKDMESSGSWQVLVTVLGTR